MSSWLNEKNERVTKDTLIATCPSFVAEPLAYYAMRAILKKVEETGKPKMYLIDIAQDFTILHKGPQDRFVYGIRVSGTVCLSPFNVCVEGIHSMEAHEKTFDYQWYTFDISDVRNGDDYNEPQLRPVSYEEAVRFLSENMPKKEEEKHV